MINMKRSLTFLFTLLISVSCCFAAVALDRVVAVVNDDVVTQSELRSEMHNVTIQYQASGQPVPPAQELRKMVLDHLIDKRLELQIAKQLKLHVSDQELNSVIQRIAASNRMTSSELLQRIQQEGIHIHTYKQNLREQLLLQKVQQHEVASKITITPDEFNRALQSKKWKTRLGNKQPDARTKKMIENDVLQQKFVTASKDWLTKIRGFAYIDIKPETP